MESLSKDTIKHEIADSAIIFHRGQDIFYNDELLCVDNENDTYFKFRYDGNYGVYEITIDLEDEGVRIRGTGVSTLLLHFFLCLI